MLIPLTHFLRRIPIVTRRVAIINESDNLTAGDLARASAALQIQVTDQFGPRWHIIATVDCFPTLQDLPQGYWPVVVRDFIGGPSSGVHVSETGDKPFALVVFSGAHWTITLSHEVLELLADPFGTTFLTGPSLRTEQTTVEYLAEICDPCQADKSAYDINGVLVTDFVTPDFYAGFGAGKYSFGGQVTAPRTVLPGGYITWHEAAPDAWWQQLFDGSAPRFQQIDLSELRPDIHLRGLIDQKTESVMARAGKRSGIDAKRLGALRKRSALVRQAQAQWWQRQIERVLKPTAQGPVGHGPASRNRRTRGK